MSLPWGLLSVLCRIFSVPFSPQGTCPDVEVVLRFFLGIKPPKPSQLARVSISLERGLLEKLEQLRRDAGYANRSEFVRDLIRHFLVERAWERDGETIGAIVLLYDHHTPGLNEKLLAIQHEHHANVLATTHVHLDHHHCLEVAIVRGRARELQGLADALRRPKGVLHGGLLISGLGQELR